MALYSHIQHCMHCREELVNSERVFNNAIITIRQCPQCTYKFVLAYNENVGQDVISVRTGPYRVIIWEFVNGAYQCSIDLITLLEGVTYNVAYEGFIAEITMVIGELAKRVVTTKERVNFNLEDPVAFHKKVKMMVTFS